MRFGLYAMRGGGVGGPSMLESEAMAVEEDKGQNGSNFRSLFQTMSSSSVFGLWIINKAGGLIYHKSYAGQHRLSRCNSSN